MSNILCEALGIRYPIILGGLARIGTAPLAAAVSNAGGLGLLGAGPWDGPELTRQINRTREICDGVFGVNIPILSENSEDLIEIVIKEGIRVVSTSAGNPRRFISRLKEHGIYVIHVVPTVFNALSAAEAGVDAIVAEGSESGGMTSPEQISTMVLVPQVVDAVECPVIAAGGIGDGRGLAASLALGAVGVQMGTVFLSSFECEVAPVFKEMLIRAKETDTELIPLGKAMRRAFKEAFHKSSVEQLSHLSFESPLDVDTSLTAAGQVSGLIHEVRPVAEIIEQMIEQAREILPGLSERLTGK